MFLEWDIPEPDTKSVFTVKSSIVGEYNIKSLKKQFQNMFNEGFNGLLEQNKRIKNWT
ncbi:MAG: hypothetical protein FWF46_09275 [Oscillospiraceae bacterium]|jgi:hypothetical protein|nr:hypothetical protein [Oscillospiraceae bacterium]